MRIPGFDPGASEAPVEKGSARRAYAREALWLPALAALALAPCGTVAVAQSTAPQAGAHAEHAHSEPHAAHGETHAGHAETHSAHSEPHAAHAETHAAHAGTHAADADPHAQHKAMQQSPPVSGPVERLAVPDAELVTQHGNGVKLASDVIGDRLVVMDFVYTTCTTVCPVLSAIFGQVQARLGDRVGRDVAMVSISVDPVRDTPARLNAYAAKIGARDGWTWLTGPKPTVDETLRELGAYTPNFEDHPSMVLIGDGRTGEWIRLLGFPGADQIVAKVNALAAARSAAGR